MSWVDRCVDSASSVVNDKVASVHMVCDYIELSPRRCLAPCHAPISVCDGNWFKPTSVTHGFLPPLPAKLSLGIPKCLCGAYTMCSMRLFSVGRFKTDLSTAWAAGSVCPRVGQQFRPPTAATAALNPSRRRARSPWARRRSFPA